VLAQIAERAPEPPAAPAVAAPPAGDDVLGEDGSLGR
jgi:hypothetical protein